MVGTDVSRSKNRVQRGAETGHDRGDGLAFGKLTLTSPDSLMSAITAPSPASSVAIYTTARKALDAVRTVVHVLRAVAAGIRAFLGFFGR